MQSAARATIDIIIIAWKGTHPTQGRVWIAIAKTAANMLYAIVDDVLLSAHLIYIYIYISISLCSFGFINPAYYMI
jgi:hypothetical protein